MKCDGTLSDLVNVNGVYLFDCLFQYLRFQPSPGVSKRDHWKLWVTRKSCTGLSLSTFTPSRLGWHLFSVKSIIAGR